MADPQQKAAEHELVASAAGHILVELLGSEHVEIVCPS
jgi:hypothetical protein